MVIDLDRCTGCGACMVACAVENNLPTPPVEAQDNRGLTWLRVYQCGNGRTFPDFKTVFIPVPCMQCDHAPCIHVCPVTAVDYDTETGIVGQIPERCMGCRYCMAACPYHARTFNWWDPVWPKGMEKSLNPDVSPRMRGTAEKCNFCHGRLHRAREKAASEGRRDLNPGEYIPACVEACPTRAIHFGDLQDSEDPVAKLSKSPHAFRLLESLRTFPKVFYLSRQDWVKDVGKSRLEMLRKDIYRDSESESNG
ncbi:MAG: 4Fe-4S dicluster domain-containing protein [Candidatus Eisenbacteria bacterium]|uniref:4Fe-4S dicluster domain-containing protein n=1 Tax=Eiseniibacteriota bacterium TaxID=2212470 RepID=A0A948RX57_UNCEI|nr:4Fe-4S dicluster domain-containing protein [Candidatus Eisenbacteria bacterium]MBU1949483.1 4Fe-4S dicluster domain-containing protein [Candidatus Eisenbacteria bacterium]MBU2690672.1 4Fe-4S dicluster domain-containing protein [Candidatus Eisenbacteria bacterium]